VISRAARELAIEDLIQASTHTAEVQRARRGSKAEWSARQRGEMEACSASVRACAPGTGSASAGGRCEDALRQKRAFNGRAHKGLGPQDCGGQGSDRQGCVWRSKCWYRCLCGRAGSELLMRVSHKKQVQADERRARVAHRGASRSVGAGRAGGRTISPSLSHCASTLTGCSSETASHMLLSAAPCLTA
jgi:hypothetical protein